MDNRLVVVSLWAEDVPSTVAFYRDVLGLRLVGHTGGHHHFDLGGTYLVVLQGRPNPPGDPVPERFPIFALQVDDLDAAIEQLYKHQVELPWGVEGGSNTRYVMFYDPAGNLIELVEFLEA